MGSILDLLFEIISVPLQRWDKLKFSYKVVITVIVFALFIIVLLSSSSCSFKAKNEDVIVDEKYIQKYTDEEIASELLIETWKPVITFVENTGANSMETQEFYDTTTNISKEYFEYLVTVTTEKQDDGTYIFHHDLWFPTIMDPEVTIKSVEIVEKSSVKHGFVLIIEESGSYVDKMFGYTRKNIFVFDENGKPMLIDTRGALFKASYR